MTSTQPHLIDAVPNGLLGAQSSQSEQNRLALIWGEFSKPAETFQRYKKTAVLMLYWEDSDLDTKPEVRCSTRGNEKCSYKYIGG